jgi:rubrerythrin
VVRCSSATHLTGFVCVGGVQDGKTPLDLASNTAIVELLRAAGLAEEEAARKTVEHATQVQDTPQSVLSPQQSEPEEQQQQQLTPTLDAAHAATEAAPSAASVSHPVATLSADEEEETEVEATLEHVVSAAAIHGGE